MQVILIHGLGQAPSSWDQTVSRLRQPVAADCPDLTALLGKQAVSYENLYRAFSAYCGGLPGPLNLCGLSLGGVLALQYAIEKPARVQSLALIGAQYRMPEALLCFQNLLFRLMPRAAFRGMGFQKSDLIRLTKSMARLDFSRRLKEISCPALILCGEKDGANQKAARSLAAQIQGAKFQRVEKAGHEANVDAPEQLAAALNAFYQCL